VIPPPANLADDHVDPLDESRDHVDPLDEDEETE
jgi:hypothetical protein